MKRFTRPLSMLLALALILSVCACGKSPLKKSTQSEKGISAENMQIGVLLPDSAASGGQSYFHLLGIEKAMDTLKITKEPILQKNITDVRFTQAEKLSVSEAPETTEEPTTEKPTEPETFTDKDGNVFIHAVPIKPSKKPTASEAMAELLDAGCNIFVAVDPIYDDFTAWVAAQYPDKYFLQYRGTHTELDNLQPYGDDLYEAFYLAGAAAAAAGAKNIGFVAGRRTELNRNYINAFALGAAKGSAEAKVTARFTGTDFDLSLERTVPETLLKKDKCDGIAQSVYTALPQVTAADADNTLCIGFGYDMAADGGEKNLCSVVYHFDVYFTEVLTALRDGTFTAKPYVGNTANGMVGLSAIRSKDEKVQAKVTALQKSLGEGNIQIRLPQKGYCKNVTVK